MLNAKYVIIFQDLSAIWLHSPVTSWSLITFNNPMLLKGKVETPKKEFRWRIQLNGTIFLNLIILIQMFATEGFATAINSAEKLSEIIDKDKQSKPTEN